VTGLTALAGVLIFHFADLKQFKPAFSDLPMALWCLIPLLSAITHWNTIHEGISGTCYQTLSWGVPWIFGRLYFSEYQSLLLAAKASVIAGVCYLPVCLIEIFTGPQFYALVYGYQPYRWIGAERYVGFRPIGFLEDGNQLGIWMAAATLIAICLYMRRLATRILGLPMAWVAAALAVVTLLCQSAGSILLLLLLAPLALTNQRIVLRACIAVLLCTIAVFALIRMTGKVSLRAIAQQNPIAHSISVALNDVGRHSFAWRLGREESDMNIALANPLLGSGRWNWWQEGDSRPWSLWFLVLGMYGLIGLAALALILFLPVIIAVWASAPGNSSVQFDLRLMMVALILLVAFDNLLNGAMILPYLLIFAGMTTNDRQVVHAKILARRVL
jgi:hypothetical protein